MTTALCIALSLLSGCHSSFSRSGDAPDANPPQVLTVVEESGATLSSACHSGTGMRIIHGIDYNHDGRLGPYERKRLDVICPPSLEPGSNEAVAALR